MIFSSPEKPPNCELHKVHNPIFALSVTWKINDTDSIEVCPTGYSNLDVAVEYLRGKILEMPVRLGHETWNVAIDTVRFLGAPTANPVPA